MIKNALATERDKLGELCEKILSLYNSKANGGLDIQLHQLFDNVRMGNVTFAEGISTNIWAGILTRIHKSAPGLFSSFFLFSEMKGIGGDNNNDRSLLIEIFSLAKGGLMKSMDKVKSLAKTTVTVLQDFHSFVYQFRAFAHASSFFFGNKSILAIQLKEFVANIEGRHCITYKNIIAPDSTFATKILWLVDNFVQLFLKDCRKRVDQEDVDQQVIDFDALNMDVIMFCFHADFCRYRFS
jgi:hypothetical protein